MPTEQAADTAETLTASAENIHMRKTVNTDAITTVTVTVDAYSHIQAVAETAEDVVITAVAEALMTVSAKITAHAIHTTM